ncbi:hypothetical protein BH09PSE5_BH09PSE5_18070 [soil metagenome]
MIGDSEALAAGLAVVLGFAAMASLGLATERHFEHFTGRPAPMPWLRRALRLVGALLLISCAAACIGHWGAGVGSAACFAILTAGAMLVAWPLTYLPRRTPHRSTPGKET